MYLIFNNNFSLSKLSLKKIKTLLLLAFFIFSSLNIFAQSTSLISACGDFDAGSTASVSYTHLTLPTILLV